MNIVKKNRNMNIVKEINRNVNKKQNFFKKKLKAMVRWFILVTLKHTPL
jgi:hypothetical protein